MIGRTNASGGGGLNKSVIIVTAPTGSTVTCKSGTTTKTAAEKNGTWTFTGLDNGTWTVTATKDSNTATKSVTISRLTIEYVTIAYVPAGLVLFDNGDQNSAVTGGWKGASASGAKVTIGNAILFETVASSSRDAAAYTVNKIDCTKYSLIKAYVNITNAGIALHVGATNANTGYVPTFVVDKKSTASGEQIMTADISSLTGSFYICIYADATAAEVSKIVLE